MYEKEKTVLENYAKQNGSTSEQGIEQEDGSLVVLRSVQGDPCEEETISAADRADRGWPKIEVEE